MLHPKYCLLLLLGCPSIALAINNGIPPDEEDLRFDAVGALSFGRWLGLDPDANNSWDHNWYCNATLISPTVAITANHCVDLGLPDFYAIRFRRHLDGSLGTKDAGVDSYHHVYVSEVVQTDLDFSVLYLAEAVTHIEPIPPLTYGVWGLGDSTEFWHAGWGKEGPEYDEGPRNELLLCHNLFIGTSERSVFFLGMAPFSGCGVNVHDSGSPVILEDAKGNLRVGGVVSSLFPGGNGSGPNLAYFAEDSELGIEHKPFEGIDLVVVVREDLDEECISSDSSPIFVSPLMVNAGSESAKTPQVGGELSDIFSGKTFALAPVDASNVGAGYNPFQGDLDIPANLPASTYALRITIDPEDRISELFEDNTWDSRAVYQSLSISPNPAERAQYVLGAWLKGADLDGFVNVFDGDNGTLAVVAYSYSHERSIRAPNIMRSKNNTYRFEEGEFVLTLQFADDAWTYEIEGENITEIVSENELRHGPFGFSSGVYLPEDFDSGSPDHMAIQLPTGQIISVWKDKEAGMGMISEGQPDSPDQIDFMFDDATAALSWDKTLETMSMTITDGDGVDVADAPLFLRAPPPLEIGPDKDLDSGSVPGDSGAFEDGEAGGCGCASTQGGRGGLSGLLILLGLVIGRRRRVQA
jgi:MYXO-CTERM domain-containing protein